jgi:Cu(I)/Ag(I) efflux system membrane fusion protein
MNRTIITIAVVASLGAAIGIGYWFGSHPAATPRASATAEAGGKRVMYWFDPMKPETHFDNPGKSPFMDMQLVAKYADNESGNASLQPLYWFDPMKPETHFDKPGKSPFMDMQLVPKYPDAAGVGSVRIDPATVQSLGMRTAVVEIGSLAYGLRVPGTIGWDLREASIVSARADGVIEHLYVRAPFERVKAGQPLATLIAPAWNAAAQEYMALGRAESADARALHAAAGDRLRSLGMDETQIRNAGRSGGLIVLRAPSDGVVGTLDVRQGQRVGAGMQIMTINGERSVWLEAAIPQAQSHGVVAGTAVQASVSSQPGRKFTGHVEALLPEVDAATRTQRARIVLDNADGALAPGMFAELQLRSAAGDSHPLVPDEALIETGDASRVIVADDSGHYRPVAVRTGMSSGGKTEILAGLKGGERVVVSGQFLIDSEASLSGALERLPPAADAAQEPQQ